MKRFFKFRVIFGLLFFSFLIHQFYYDDTYIKPQMIVAQGQTQREFDSIHILPGSIFIKSNQVSNARFTNLTGDYTTKLSSDKFCKYYSEEAKKNGWILKRDRVFENYRGLDFLKDELYLRIGYNVEAENHDYSITISWDYDQKNNNYLIPKL